MFVVPAPWPVTTPFTTVATEALSVPQVPAALLPLIV